MLIHKGFIKVSNDGTFYPISRIKSMSSDFCNGLKTKIEFDDGKFVIIDKGIIDTINLLNGGKE